MPLDAKAACMRHAIEYLAGAGNQRTRCKCLGCMADLEAKTVA
jgi:hypothetical protein